MRARPFFRSPESAVEVSCGRPASLAPNLAAVALIAAAAIAPVQTVRAQSAAKQSQAAADARWNPWLGCWQADSDAVAAGRAGARYTCVVPTARPTAVDVVALVGGSIVSRSRIDVNGRSHAIDQGACQGDETATWSDTRHRVYLRSNYSCGGVEGTSTRLFAIAPGGDWLEVETVRAGGGSVDHVTRRHDVGVPGDAPAEVARSLAGRSLALSTARAAAAAPIGAADVIEAVHSVDAGTVRSWLVASNAHVQLTGADAQALMHADVPTSVMQAMMGETHAAAGSDADEANRRADEYLRSTSMAASGIAAQGEAPAPAPEGVICNAGGCYTPMGNAYSQYNGYSYSPYGPYPYPVTPYYGGYWYGAPVVIVHGGRGQGRPEPVHQRPGPVGVPAPRPRPPNAPLVHTPSRPRP
jgi:hypothetical protein